MAVDNLNRPTTLTYPGSTFTAAYTDASGNPKIELQKLTDPMSHYTQLTYDSLSRVRVNQDRCGHQDKICYGNGVVCSTTNALNEVTTYTYDHVGRLIKLTYHDGVSETNRYDFLGRLTNSVNAAGAAVTNYFNHQGLLTVVSNAFGQVLTNQYDVFDRVTNTINAAGLAVGTAYDLLNRVTQRLYPDSTSEGFGYSARGLIAYTNRLGKVTTYALDVLGRKITETNPNSEVTHYEYNAGSDLTKLIDAKNQTNRWDYDQFGRMTNWVDASGAIIQTNSYDSLGRLLKRWTPARILNYTYNEEDNVLGSDDGMGQLTGFSYDGLHRLTTAFTWQTPTYLTNRFSYTSWGALASEDGPWDNDTLTYTYDNAHRSSGFSLQQPSASAWNVNYGYDLANRIQTITDPNGTYTYSYPNPGGMINKLSLPNGGYVTNVFDSLTRVIATYLKNSSLTVLNSHLYQFNAENQRTKQTRADGSYVDLTYDSAGQLKSALGKESGGSTRLNEQFGFLYDAANNLNQRTNNALVQTFGVDSRNRLTTATRSGTLTVAGTTSASATSVTVNGSSASLYADKTFAKSGVSLVDGNNTFTAIAQDSLGRGDTNSLTLNLPATVNYTYDANGNLTGDGKWTYSYNKEDRLSAINDNSQLAYLYYDALGRLAWRVEQKWNGSAWVTTNELRYVYAGKLILQERDANNLPKVTYTRGLDLGGSFENAGGIGGLLARTDNSQFLTTPLTAVAYYHSDGNGNVSMLINGNQAPVAKYLYDPFGNTISASGPLADANTYRFSSKEIHAASGLYYFGLRWYNPNLQRFMSRDPSGMVDGPNLYAYVGNRATYAYDAWGLAPQIAVIWIPDNGPATVQYGQPGLGVDTHFSGIQWSGTFPVTSETTVYPFDFPWQDFNKLQIAIDGTRKRLLEENRMAGQPVFIPDDGGINLADNDILNAFAAWKAAQLAAGTIKTVAGTISGALSKTVPAAASATPSGGATLGATALKGIGDDMLVHFSSAASRPSIAENGLINPGNGISFFRVGDVKNLTPLQVQNAIGWGGTSSVDASLAVIVSPNAATFTRGVLTLPEYTSFASQIPWTLIRKVP